MSWSESNVYLFLTLVTHYIDGVEYCPCVEIAKYKERLKKHCGKPPAPPLPKYYYPSPTPSTSSPSLPPLAKISSGSSESDLWTPPRLQFIKNAYKRRESGSYEDGNSGFDKEVSPP